MPRPKVYGKKNRSTVAYQLVSNSSPEQPCRITASAALLAETIQTCKDVVSRWETENHDDTIEPKRKVLGERNANSAVVAPQATKAKKQPKIPKMSAPASGSVGPDKTPEHRQSTSTANSQLAPKNCQTAKSLANEVVSVQKETFHIAEGASNAPVAQAKDNANLPRNSHTLDDMTKQHCSSILSLSACAESSFSTFESWDAEIAEHFRVTKIAEASFGEVYRLSLLSSLPAITRSDESVFKIIALKCPPGVLPKDKKKRKAILKDEEYMSAPEDVVNEIRLLHRMSCIPGFTNFRDVRILQGRPVGAFVDAFHSFDQNQKAQGKDGSHFPDPELKTSYSTDQLWAVIEMQDAGTDLEQLVETARCTSIWTTWDLFWNSTIALAMGEQGANFEHRDLHLGNICVHNAPAQTDVSDFLDMPIDPKKNLGFTAVETTIIDYTLSRADLHIPSDVESSAASEPADTDRVAYKDLSLDASLFQADSTYEYQYDIYRYMRGVVFADDAYHDFESGGEDFARDWSQYHPQTNLVWMHFILYKLLEQISWPSAVRAPPRGRGKKRIAAEQQRYARWKRGNELETILLQVQELLDPGQICVNGLGSAGDLVALAMNEGWLDIADVIGDDARLETEEEDLVSGLQAMSLAGAIGVQA